MSIDNIKHCLKVMVDCEVCEECNLYGTTGTDHCEHDCVYGALDIIDKYQKIEQIVSDFRKYQKGITWGFGGEKYMQMVSEVVEDGTN